mmetsp:Transcript_3093/g.9805  ORF Transcript_3093/g.9805 Transcript_3093/m.9805 type:complete len:301 (-) Transcript_3093:101-1003(-)
MHVSDKRSNVAERLAPRHALDVRADGRAPLVPMAQVGGEEAPYWRHLQPRARQREAIENRMQCEAVDAAATSEHDLSGCAVECVTGSHELVAFAEDLRGRFVVGATGGFIHAEYGANGDAGIGVEGVAERVQHDGESWARSRFDVRRARGGSSVVIVGIERVRGGNRRSGFFGVAVLNAHLDDTLVCFERDGADPGVAKRVQQHICDTLVLSQHLALPHTVLSVSNRRVLHVVVGRAQPTAEKRGDVSEAHLKGFENDGELFVGRSAYGRRGTGTKVLRQGLQAARRLRSCRNTAAAVPD